METFPDRMLLADDRSRQAEHAAKLAAGLSRALGSEVHAVRAVEGSSELYMPPGWAGLGLRTRDDVFERAGREAFERALREAREELEDTMEGIKRAGGKIAEIHVRTGRPDSEIVELAEEVGVGLVVIGSRGQGPFKRALLGSVSTSVVRHAHCPVLVTRGEEEALPERMLVAVDGSGNGARARDGRYGGESRRLGVAPAPRRSVTLFEAGEVGRRDQLRPGGGGDRRQEHRRAGAQRPGLRRA